MHRPVLGQARAGLQQRGGGSDLLGPGAWGVHHLALGPLGLGCLLSLPLLLGRLLLALQPALVPHHALVNRHTRHVSGGRSVQEGVKCKCKWA